MINDGGAPTFSRPFRDPPDLLFQILTGAILDQVGRINGAYLPEAFQVAFWVCTLTAGICLALSFILAKQPASQAAPETD